MNHSYPKDLAISVCEHWDEVCSPSETGSPRSPASKFSLSLPVLEELISTCYQASLLPDEERPARFRLILQDPERINPFDGPPSGLHRIVLTEPLLCDERELSRCSMATDFHRSLIGVRRHPEKGLQIWGFVHSGSRWIQTLYGGSQQFHPLPDCVVILVTNPGHISVCKGSYTVASLSGGQIIDLPVDVFNSQWLRECFAPALKELWDQHISARVQAGGRWAMLDRNVMRAIKHQVLRRIIGLPRYFRHGGAFVFIPPERSTFLLGDNRSVALKYKFVDEEPRDRFRSLLLKIISSLVETDVGEKHKQGPIGWEEYLSIKSQALAELDEALFEWAHFVSGLSAMDGAVFLSTRFEILGFGGVISGELPMVDVIAKALDPEGEKTVRESTKGVGLRHLSAYRLCNELHDVTAVVVSQEGDIQFIKWKNGLPTCWNQMATSILGA